MRSCSSSQRATKAPRREETYPFTIRSAEMGTTHECQKPTTRYDRVEKITCSSRASRQATKNAAELTPRLSVPGSNTCLGHDPGHEDGPPSLFLEGATTLSVNIHQLCGAWHPTLERGTRGTDDRDPCEAQRAPGIRTHRPHALYA